MLKLSVMLEEGFDETKQEFVATKSVALELEHSLASLSKWESKWEKPFLGKEDKTTEETLDYIRCMIVNPDFPPEVFSHFSQEDISTINAYINAKMTATWFNERKTPPSREIITAEVIYYWMVSLQIPFECQHWHLNRLLTLIKVCNMKNAPQKPMGRRAQADMQRQLNADRKARLSSNG